MATETRLVSFGLVMALASPSAAETLNLICTGGGTANKSDTITTHRQDSKGDFRTSTTEIDSPRDFAGDLNVEITDGAGRIRPPRTLVPELRGGKDGWFTLRNLVVDQTAITAKVAFNFFQQPRLRIDRLTGSISIDGDVGNYSGQCRPFDPATAKRVF